MSSGCYDCAGGEDEYGYLGLLRGRIKSFHMYEDESISSIQRLEALKI